jgi:hypothetical protein
MYAIAWQQVGWREEKQNFVRKCKTIMCEAIFFVILILYGKYTQLIHIHKSTLCSMWPVSSGSKKLPTFEYFCFLEYNAM